MIELPQIIQLLIRELGFIDEINQVEECEIFGYLRKPKLVEALRIRIKADNKLLIHRWNYCPQIPSYRSYGNSHRQKIFNLSDPNPLSQIEDFVKKDLCPI